MPRRRRPEPREVLPDPLYNSTLVEKFVNSMMWDGKKNTAQKIFYQAMDVLRERSGDDPLGDRLFALMHQAIHKLG